MFQNTPETLRAYDKLVASKLFEEKELEVARSWLEERPIEYTYADSKVSVRKAVGLSPAKVELMTGYKRNYIQILCKQNKIECYRDVFSWYLVPVDEIIALKAKKLAKKG